MKKKNDKVMDTAMPALGASAKALFSIAPENRSINFGSYGCPPVAMTTKRFEHYRRIDQDTDLFMRVTGEKELRDVRKHVAAFVGTAESFEDADAVCDDILLVDNAAYAYNVVAQGILHNPRFHWARNSTELENSAPRPKRMLMFDRQYPMCKQATAFWNERGGSTAASPLSQTPGFVEVTEFPLTNTTFMDGSDDALVRALCEEVISKDYDFLLIDHVCWSPAFVFPIERICRLIREAETCKRKLRRTVIVVDGAHAVGNIDLRGLFRANKEHKLFDAYFSNFHKWLSAPRHAAFLYVERSLHAFLHPPVISNFYRGVLPLQSTVACSEAMQHEFFWCGTRDYSNFLVIPDVIAYRQAQFGGEKRIRQYCHKLAHKAAVSIAQIWRTTLVVPDATRLCSMSNVYCPAGCTLDDATQVTNIMLASRNTFGAIMDFGGRPFLRVSAQVYNSLDDYLHFANEFLEILGNRKKSKTSQPRVSKL